MKALNNTFKVHMLAYAEDDTTVRTVTIPEPRMLPEPVDVDHLLELIFEFGQNDFQPQPNCPSVSMGDVVELNDGSFHLVAPFGFSKISPKDLARYRAIPRRDRFLFTPSETL